MYLSEELAISQPLRIPHSSTDHNVQLALPHYWFCHAWLCRPGNRPIHRHISRDWSVCFELGSTELLPSKQHHGVCRAFHLQLGKLLIRNQSMEACCVRCRYQITNAIKEQIDVYLGRHHSMQWAWRSGRCLHRSTKGSATLYHGHLGFHRVNPQCV